ncbi:MAG: hypothetical protein AUJ92_10690 [Armatimonadetes bacterium CG2_30_59_28]|nr:dihydrodipicolinate reductase [Armatimonadota bacterium]OIO94146.1 MAG: hypothetical protein AUJ92_10690 [Armatimonadetes bacterium CG2_30_59_28]PIU64424.1 MAG: dihydrodipicolinate reductase [Armatimonadetes bacterium CG07_land_8_20_14_0_80_59_28]PIX45656.1 MAG: dihydrodipicolinate reductase [Armatimonadetes bacterium CG_4_8_14_3_um_filter_58_9]
MKILHIGIGPLGQKVVQFAVERGLEIVAAVDLAPDKVGRDLGESCGLAPLNVPVRGSIAEALTDSKPDVAVVTTVSSLAKLEPTITELAQSKVSMVSTCEELFFPWITQPELARRIDETCRENGVSCLGTGVNPGFLMDYLTTILTGLCQKVRSVNVWRLQDASIRRVPFQEKIGAGLTLEQFKEKAATGVLRHVGLLESVDFIAHQLGWKLDSRTESLKPVVANVEVTTGHKPIATGMSRGVEQIARGFVDHQEIITLTFRASVGEPESVDGIAIHGNPSVHAAIPGGVNGDIATCAIALNAIPSLLNATPGLKTMGDIAPVTCRRSVT